MTKKKNCDEPLRLAKERKVMKVQKAADRGGASGGEATVKSMQYPFNAGILSND